MQEVEFAHWGALAPEPIASPMLGEGATLRRVQLQAGHVAARHSHTHEQFLIVLAGSGTLLSAAGEVALAPGVVIRLAPGTWHSANFTAPTVLVEVNMAESKAD